VPSSSTSFFVFSLLFLFDFVFLGSDFFSSSDDEFEELDELELDFDFGDSAIDSCMYQTENTMLMISVTDPTSANRLQQMRTTRGARVPLSRMRAINLHVQ
jgi:hypothetical protein